MSLLTLPVSLDTYKILTSTSHPGPGKSQVVRTLDRRLRCTDNVEAMWGVTGTVEGRSKEEGGGGGGGGGIQGVIPGVIQSRRRVVVKCREAGPL